MFFFFLIFQFFVQLFGNCDSHLHAVHSDDFLFLFRHEHSLRFIDWWFLYTKSSFSFVLFLCRNRPAWLLNHLLSVSGLDCLYFFDIVAWTLHPMFWSCSVQTDDILHHFLPAHMHCTLSWVCFLNDPHRTAQEQVVFPVPTFHLHVQALCSCLCYLLAYIFEPSLFRYQWCANWVFFVIVWCATVDRIDPFSSAAALHFNNVFERYGTPVYVLNLVKVWMSVHACNFHICVVLVFAEWLTQTRQQIWAIHCM